MTAEPERRSDAAARSWSQGTTYHSRVTWNGLDPSAPSEVIFLRRPKTDRIAVLLGAFDPPTNAHLSIVGAAARKLGSSGVLCLTKTLLARPPDELLPIDVRLDVLATVAAEHDLGLAIANRGTYVDVADALRNDGFDASFVIGSDKLAQLEDPSFYPDGEDGVARTFANTTFVVVPRPKRDEGRPGLRWLEVDEVFNRPTDASLSATEVRRRVRAGESIDVLVPRAVLLALGGYTSRK